MGETGRSGGILRSRFFLHIILIVDRFILMATNNGSSNFTDVFMS